MAPSPLQSGGNPFPPAPPVYLTTSSSFTLLAFKGTLKRKERSDSIRSIGADLTAANLTYAGLTNEKLEKQAMSLEGATLPHGEKYEDGPKRMGRGEGE
jgi:hypothetical protein